MNKTVKIVSIILMAVMLISTFSTVVMATTDVNTVLGQMNTGAGSVNSDDVANFGGKIMRYISTAGIVIAVIVLLIIGIKYMIAGASEKAKYKEVMIPYLIGACLLLGASIIVPVIGNIVSSFGGTAGA